MSVVVRNPAQSPRAGRTVGWVGLWVRTPPPLGHATIPTAGISVRAYCMIVLELMCNGVAWYIGWYRRKIILASTRPKIQIIIIISAPLYELPESSTLSRVRQSKAKYGLIIVIRAPLTKLLKPGRLKSVPLWNSSPWPVIHWSCNQKVSQKVRVRKIFEGLTSAPNQTQGKILQRPCL